MDKDEIQRMKAYAFLKSEGLATTKMEVIKLTTTELESLLMKYKSKSADTYKEIIIKLVSVIATDDDKRRLELMIETTSFMMDKMSESQEELTKQLRDE